MKFHIKNPLKFFAFYNKMMVTIIFYVLLSFFMLSGLFLERFFGEPYKYLFVSPSFYNYSYLNWTTSVWGSVLGIHGTIAALSITFMSMFVSQVSTASEYGFESLSKILLLRENKFLDFSIQSVCSLLCGVFLLLVGVGLIGYLISSFLSLYFIINYGLMYYRLYNLTEKPEVIKDLLFEKLNSVGKSYNNINIRRIALRNDFDDFINEINCLSTDQKIAYWNDKVITLNVFSNKPDVIISGFEPKCFETVSQKIDELHLATPPVILFYFSFFSPLSNFYVKIVPFDGDTLPESFVFDIELILRKSFYYSPVPYVYSDFKQFEEALVSNVRQSLMAGNEWSLDFSVKAFYELTSNDNYTYTLKNIDLAITSSKKKDIIDTVLFADFFEKMTDKSLSENNLEKAVSIMESLIDLSRYIYGKENYYDFYNRIFRRIENRIRYRDEESNHLFLKLYISNAIRNLVYEKSKAFKIDTNFVTSKLRYLDLHNKADHDSLNEMQRTMLRFLFEVITLLIMRIEHVAKKEEDNHEELDNLRATLKSWVTAKFLEEVYYKKETYDLLFSIPEEYSLFDSESKIREIPEGEASWRSISNDTYKMISFVLTQSYFNDNNFNVLFIRDAAEFKENTKIYTNEINSIVAYLRSDYFLNLVEIVTGRKEVKSNKEQVASKLESITSEINSLILKDVVNSELSQDLVDKYIKEINVSVANYFELILPIESMASTPNVHGKKTNLLIDKREVIPPIDGVSYSMNIHNQSQRLIYDWIHSVLGIIKDKEKQIIKINSLQDLDVEKLISIEYKVKSRSNTYRYSKGLKVNDKDGLLGLGSAGMYYLNLLESFDLKKSLDVLSVHIDKIDENNLNKLQELYDFGEDNPYLYSVLSVVFNITAIPNRNCILYFLSEELCQSMNEKQEKEMEQLIKGRRIDDTKFSDMDE